MFHETEFEKKKFECAYAFRVKILKLTIIAMMWTYFNELITSKLNNNKNKICKPFLIVHPTPTLLRRATKFSACGLALVRWQFAASDRPRVERPFHRFLFHTP